MTHTKPWPPPGAGAFAAVSVLLLFAVAPLAAAGLAAAELFGLNKSPRLNLAGDGDAAELAAAVVSAFFRARFALGEAAGEAAGDADVAGFAAVAVSAFLRLRFASGDPAGEGDSVVSADDAAV